MSVILALGKNAISHKLKKSVEEAVFTVAVLKRLGCADLSSINKRIICQKNIYFANRLGASPPYLFNLYLHGPYSPELANDLFILIDYFKDIPEVEYASDEKENAFNKLKQLMDAINNDARMLEIAATLDYFKLLNPIEIAIEKTIQVKQATKNEIEEAERLLTKYLW